MEQKQRRKPGPPKTDLTLRKEIKIAPLHMEQLDELAKVYGSHSEVIRRALALFFATVPSVTMSNSKHSKEAA